MSKLRNQSIFAPEASDAVGEKIVGEVQLPLNKKEDGPGSNGDSVDCGGCTGGISSCTHSNCYGCRGSEGEASDDQSEMSFQP